MRTRNATLLIKVSVWHVTIMRYNRHMPDTGLCQLWLRLPTSGLPRIIMHFFDTCQWSQIFFLNRNKLSSVSKHLATDGKPINRLLQIKIWKQRPLPWVPSQLILSDQNHRVLLMLRWLSQVIASRMVTAPRQILCCSDFIAVEAYCIVAMERTCLGVGESTRLCALRY